MRRVGAWLALGVLLVGTSAHAVPTRPVESSAGSQWNGQDTILFTPPAGTTAGQATFGETQFNGTPNTVTFNSFVNVTPTLVTFESGNSSTGPFVTTSSSSVVNLNFTNTTGGTITPTVASTITAAGLGFYIANTNFVDPSTGVRCIAASCPGTLAHSFADFAPTTGGVGAALAGANFSFDVIGDDRTLYSLNGSVQLFINSDGHADVVQTLNSLVPGPFVNGVVDPNDASHQLAGFAQAWGTSSAFGYAWDATNIFPTFLNSLAPGQVGFLTYETDVSSFTQSFCLADGSCLQAYSGFGDPVGRGGGISSFASPLGQLSFGAFSQPIIQGINFSPTTFQAPTLSPDGVLTFRPGVPEPATWSLMIIGFGLAGGMLRRRSARAATA